MDNDIKDSEDDICEWKKCLDSKCKLARTVAHYHRQKIYVCPEQKNTLDSWIGTENRMTLDGKLTLQEIASLNPRFGSTRKWTYKEKGLGRVKRYLSTPY